MKELYTEITIHATPEKIWQYLTAFDTYPDWNPFIKSVEGKVIPVEKFRVTLHPPGGRHMTFKPRCLVLEKQKELRWLGSLGIRGIFDGEHIFEIRDNGDGTSTFIQREIFSGILVPILWKQLNTNTRKGFEMMNIAIRKLAES